MVTMRTRAALRVTGCKGPARPTVTHVGAVQVSWPAITRALSYRLRYRLAGGTWKTVTVKGVTRLLAPLASGTWQISVAAVTVNGRGPWSPSAEISV